jgi:holo-[acyl-carrier protein] synthase
VAPIAGLGVDLARVDRFRRLLTEEKKGVVDRLFTAGEKEYSLAKKDPAPYLAVRFAAKEAFLKALGLGLRRGITWHDVEVVKDELGCPSLSLKGKAAEICRQRALRGVHLSYSHDGQYGVATVVLEKP